MNGIKTAIVDEVANPILNTHTPPCLQDCMIIEQSVSLEGTVDLVGAKNAVLVILASLILTNGTSILYNVPVSDDVLHMIELLKQLGAGVSFCQETNTVEVNTHDLEHYTVSPHIMKKMRASVLVMGPLLARFGRCNIALPGGCLLGARPIDLHLKSFEKMGVKIEQEGEFLNATVGHPKSMTLVLEYPSVGATENLMMFAALVPGVTRIVNAALEPEVLDLIEVLRGMGACISMIAPATIVIEGVSLLQPIKHTIMNDRLEAGALLLAAAITGGSVSLPYARADILEVFLLKLQEMGHTISVGAHNRGITLKATSQPQAVSFRTSPYPGFPTDLQAPMMALQCIASGRSVIHETVFENRFLHVRELQKMGAQITIQGDRATVEGVEALYGTHVIATDIRASCALALAGLAAQGTTMMTGLHHWRRGYQALEKKLAHLGAKISLKASN